jgi:hypothetical protein
LQVYFILTGDREETDIRQFPHGPRQYFRRGGIDSFLMAVPRLGGVI